MSKEAVVSSLYFKSSFLPAASNSFTGSGAGLTSLNATNVSSGTLADARLSANVPLLNGANSFSGANTFTSSLKVPVSGGAAPTASGLIAYDSTANLFKVGINNVTKTLATTDATVTTATNLAATTQCVPGTNGLATGISANGTAQCSTNGAALVSVNAADLNGLASATTATANTIAARDASANLAANQFNGSGAGLTNLNASNLTTGIIPGVRIAPTRGNIATASFIAPGSPATNSGSTATAVATCTTGVLLSGGGQVTNNDTPANPLETVMIESYPSSSTQWTVTGVTNGLTKNKTMTVNAWAICSGS